MHTYDEMVTWKEENQDCSHTVITVQTGAPNTQTESAVFKATFPDHGPLASLTFDGMEP